MSEAQAGAPRRTFLAQLGAGFALLTGCVSVNRAGAEGDTVRSVDSPHDAWLNGLNGRHRQFFHAAAANPLVFLAVRNFLDVYSREYGVPAASLNAVVGLQSSAVAMALSDEAWAKYPLSTWASATDPTTNQPARHNIFASGPDSIATMRERGVRVLVCNQTLRNRSGALAATMSMPAETIYQELRAAVLPDLIVVPAMIVAINRAQEEGISYVRQV